LSGIIRLLTDAVANQIAAGEVVQRPSSAVKELLENSIDAGADQIKLLIKDGGSTLIQVIDNGKGMSEIDARMCWERHATSKIRQAQDLFALNTYGFRGEALASIAAVAQVEMKTKRQEDELAVYIRIEGSEVIDQKLDSGVNGTSISIKNLFFNIPARRNFLKSIAVETKHIYEEFQRQAMANPQITFQLYNNNQEVFNWPATTLHERIKDILGTKKGEDFIQFEEHTEIVQIKGFVGPPQMAKKTRGDQYMFVNHRFIKSPYFHHSIMQALEGSLEKDSFPSYVIFFEVAPDKVDVNVHPTKTEVKFEDEKYIYDILKVSVRKAFGSHLLPNQQNIFQQNDFNNWISQDVRNNPFPKDSNKTSYNPFGNSPQKNRYENQDWQKILGPVDSELNNGFNRNNFGSNDHFGSSSDFGGSNFNGGSNRNDEFSNVNSPFQRANALQSSSTHGNSLIPQTETTIQISGSFHLGERLLAANLGSTLHVFDLKLAQQHILYHQFMEQLEKSKALTQQLLFPRTIELNPSKIAVLLEIMDSVKSLGFDLGHFGGNSLIINGVPAQLSNIDEQKSIEKLIEDYLNTQGNIKLEKNQSLALSMARQSTSSQSALKTQEEIQYLVQELFKTTNPQFTFDGKQIFITLGPDAIFDLFQKSKKS
jgi:DNA mismatch repair protein MutL